MKSNFKSYMKSLTLLMLINFLVYTMAFAEDSVSLNNHEIQPLPKGVSIYQLDNGLQVLLIENPAVPMVGVNVVVKVGSAYEDFRTSGMSHLLEHLLFNGTTSRTQKQLYDDVDLIGGYNNANTSEYYTNFMMVVPAEYAREGMEIQADMLFNSTLPSEKFEKEKGIVLEELTRSLNNPDEQADRNAISLLYENHALSLPTLGTYSTIENMTRDEVYQFYKANYVPNNMVMSVVGNFKSAEMLKLVKDIYGKAKPGKIVRNSNSGWHTGFQPLTSLKGKQGKVFYRFYDGDKTIMQIFYPLPADYSSEFYQLLGDQLSEKSRKIEYAARQKFGDAIGSVSLSLRQSPVINFIEVKISANQQNNWSELKSFIAEQLAGTNWGYDSGLIEAKIAEARTEFLRNIEKPHMFGIYNAYKFAVSGIEAVLASYSGRELLRANEQLLKFNLGQEPIILVQMPALKSDSTENSLKTQLFRDDSTGKTLIVVQNSSSNLLAIHYLIKHKAMYEEQYGKDAAKILHDCLGQRLNNSENQKTGGKYGLKYKVNDYAFIPMDDIYLHPDFGYIRVEGLADSIAGAVAFLNSVMEDFVPTEEEYSRAVNKFKKSMPMGMMGHTSKAEKQCEQAFNAHVFEKSKYSPGDDEIAYQELVAFAREYFQPGNMIISVVSPAAPEEIDSYFAPFQGRKIENEPPAEDKRLILNEKPVTLDFTGGEKQSFLHWGFVKKINPADAPALQALSLILSDKIVFDIREKRGMAYRMSAGISVYDDKALFYIKQGTRPQNVDLLLSIYPDFFNSDMVKNLSERELKKSGNMYLGRMMFRRLSSINRAYYLANSLYFHGDMNYDSQFLEKLKQVTVKDVKAVAKKYLKARNPVSVVVR